MVRIVHSDLTLLLANPRRFFDGKGCAVGSKMDLIIDALLVNKTLTLLDMVLANITEAPFMQLLQTNQTLTHLSVGSMCVLPPLLLCNSQPLDL